MDFELSSKNCPCYDSCSMQAQTSTYRKCPIYVHTFDKSDKGDFVPKKTKKVKNKQSFVDKLEEHYWANWKPDKGEEKCVKSHKVPPEIKIIKSAPTERRRKFKVFPNADDAIKVETVQVETQVEIIEQDVKKASKSQEIQTEICTKDESNNTKEECVEQENTEVEDSKFLKHTDSFILNQKKHKEGEDKEEEEHFEQPHCIRLYRKPGKNLSKNYVKGGSYPLKSCLKKESVFSKGNVRLGRPGSPLIVSSNYSSKHGNKTHHHR